jgi:hypothetical protein
MFSNKRYITKGVDNDIPIDIQMFLWSCIDKMKQQGQQLDYLEVFELGGISNTNIINQEVVHSQEIPLYIKRYAICVDKPIDTKIFVIDDLEQSVMMLAEEY